MAIEPDRPVDDELPDPALFWRWVGKATRPVIGWVLLAVSALFILFGWIGVSGTPVVAKQIPYVVSGGIFGVFLAVFGAYFLGTEELRKDSGRLDRLERMVAGAAPSALDARTRLAGRDESDERRRPTARCTSRSPGRTCITDPSAPWSRRSRTRRCSRRRRSASGS